MCRNTIYLSVDSAYGLLAKAFINSKSFLVDSSEFLM